MGSELVITRWTRGCIGGSIRRNHQIMRKLIAITSAGLITLTGCTNPKAGQGIMVGGVTSTGALAQVRLTRTDKLVRSYVQGPSGARWDVPGKAGVVEFSLLAAGGSDVLETQLVEAKAQHDFIARAAFKKLRRAQKEHRRDKRKHRKMKRQL